MRFQAIVWIAAAATSVTACKWTEFDDLADTTWAHSQTKPNVPSSDWALDLVSAQHSGAGGQIAVLGANKPTFSTLTFDTKGNTKLGSGLVDLTGGGVGGLSSLPDARTVISDPATDTVALVTPLSSTKSLILTETPEAGQTAGPLTLKATVTDSSTTAAFAPGSSALLISGTIGTPPTTGLFHSVDIVGQMQTTTCDANDDMGVPLNAQALTIVGTTAVAWAADGSLLQYDLAAAQGNCLAPTPPITPTQAVIATGFRPGPRSKLFPLDGTFVLLAGIPDMDGMGELVIYDLSTGNPTGVPATFDGMRSVAFGTIAGTPYVAVGEPAHLVGSVEAGQVEVHEIDPINHIIKDVIALALNDAQPEANQSFGQAVEIMHFNDDNIIVVAGDNELYAYYETLIYSDTRK